MSEAVVVALIAAGGLLASAVLQVPRRLRDPRHDLERDLKLLKELPDGSRARVDLQESIDGRIIALVTPTGDERRNMVGVTLGLMLGALSGYGAWWLWQQGAWWRILAAVLALFAVIMLSIIRDDWQKAPRTKTGTRLERVKDQVGKV